ncbi:capping protein muscle Z-line, alpha 2 [Obelidium mucronatum]|nr:capping protein muscle Z-line, alpha 2 [Obelidium mucronatum]
MSDTAETLATIAHFVSEAPPGELSEVLNDIRGLVNNDELLQEGIVKPFAEYNINSLLVIRSESGEKLIVSKHNQIEDGRFVDFKSKQSFVVDHVAQALSDPQPFEVNAEVADHRAALESSVEAYTQDHYPNGDSAVFAGEGRSLVIVIVNNKFNPSNFWNGRWISEWTVALDSDLVSGELKAHVHYYEDGNVQLKTVKHINTQLSSISSDPIEFASAVVKTILKAETEYQLAVNVTYGQISDTTFKSLRRALPITRTKLDWNSVANYKIGAELSNK